MTEKQANTIDVSIEDVIDGYHVPAKPEQLMIRVPPTPRLRPLPADAAPQPATPLPQTAANHAATLLEISAHLVSVLNPSELVEHFVERVVTALPAIQGGILWLYEQQQGRLRVASVYGLPLEEPTVQMLRTCHLRHGEGLAGLALQKHEPVLAEARLGYRDTAEFIAPASQALFQQLSDQLPRKLASVAIPLQSNDDTGGVLELLSFDETVDGSLLPAFVSTDIQVLQTFGNLAAAALRNAKLYTEAEDQRRRLKAFDAVVTAISTATDLEDLMQSVLGVVAGLVPGSCGALLLLEREHGRLEFGAHHGLPAACVAALQSIPLADAFCEEVVYYGHPMLRPLLEERGEDVFLAAGLESCAYLPLLAGGTVAGVLALYGDANLQRQADMATLMPLCNQVGFAIANVRLYDDSQSERRKLNTVINSIAEGVILCDSRGRLILSNEATAAMLNTNSLPFEQPVGELAETYNMRGLDGETLPPAQLPFERALAGETFYDYRLLASGASGENTVVSFSAAPARTYDGTIEGVVIVLRDVTANQRLERAKDEFLAVAAHELRSPLAAVRSYADLLLRREQQRTEANPQDLHGLTILTQQVSHMLRMVDNLLDLSRIDAGQIDLQLQRVNLVFLTHQVLDQHRYAAGERELVLETDQIELWVECDALRIRQVLTNLVGNAIKYSPAQGQIIIYLTTVEPSETPGEPHQLTSADSDQMIPEALVTIADMGKGIPEDQQGRLFQRFYRTNGTRAEGLGLGLYLSRQFVLMHGGRIWVESIGGSGSTFSFTLPLTH